MENIDMKWPICQALVETMMIKEGFKPIDWDDDFQFIISQISEFIKHMDNKRGLK
jgi:hypothetical protein